MDYLEFELRIAEKSGDGYPLTVTESPAGRLTHEATFRLPFESDEALNSSLASLHSVLYGGPSSKRDLIAHGAEIEVVEPDPQFQIEKFGHQLFEALFPKDVDGLYRASRTQAAADGKGLRLRLWIDAPDLAALPWEFLWDKQENDYVCLNNETPLARYLPMGSTPDPPVIEQELRILGVIGNHEGLDVGREQEALDKAVGRLNGIELKWLPGATASLLSEYLSGEHGDWHVFHFVGHGGFDTKEGLGLIALETDAEEGDTKEFSADKLARHLRGTSVKLAVINACEGARSSRTDTVSSTAATLIRAGLPAVVAMQYEITDGAAIKFAKTFYRNLARGLPVDAAVSEARKLVSNADTLEWGTPVLHMRAQDGRLFALPGDLSPRTDFRNYWGPLLGASGLAFGVGYVPLGGGLLFAAIAVLAAALGWYVSERLPDVKPVRLFLAGLILGLSFNVAFNHGLSGRDNLVYILTGFGLKAVTTGAVSVMGRFLGRLLPVGRQATAD